MILYIQVEPDRLAWHVTAMTNICTSLSADIMRIEDDMADLTMLLRYCKAVMLSPLGKLYGRFPLAIINR